MKLGSLFDGAGGFPFAAQQYGIKPVWASEIEPFPVAVTSKRFPNMKHLGDVTKINGAEIEPVDIITFGSPCQDLSVAGKRAGLDGERSGLFMQAIRIIKEMRGATNGVYPRIAVWENVPGAFSSAKGEDFRAVLEAFCRIIDENADVPRPANGKWSYAGEIVGDGYSVAWRVLDPRKCVPQRRRRIFLVADFRGECAGEILFKREGLSRDFAESRASWKGITKSLAFGSRDKERNDGLKCYSFYPQMKAESIVFTENQSVCLVNGTNPGFQNGILVFDTRGNGDGKICPTITGDHENRVTDYTAVVLCVRERCGCEGGGKGCLVQENVTGAIACHNDQFLCYPVALDRAAYNQGQNAQFDPGIDGESGKAFTVIAKGPGAVCYAISSKQQSLATSDNMGNTLGANDYKEPRAVCYLTPVEIILRRLTPTECARLQGMPDWWCDDVPHSDSAEYKMWGNGMALPCVLYVMEGIKEALEKDE